MIFLTTVLAPAERCLYAFAHKHSSKTTCVTCQGHQTPADLKSSLFPPGNGSAQPTNDAMDTGNEREKAKKNETRPTTSARTKRKTDCKTIEMFQWKNYRKVCRFDAENEIFIWDG